MLVWKYSWFGLKTTSDQDTARGLGLQQPPSCHEAPLNISN